MGKVYPNFGTHLASDYNTCMPSLQPIRTAARAYVFTLSVLVSVQSRANIGSPSGRATLAVGKQAGRRVTLSVWASPFLCQHRLARESITVQNGIVHRTDKSIVAKPFDIIHKSGSRHCHLAIRTLYYTSASV